MTIEQKIKSLQISISFNNSIDSAENQSLSVIQLKNILVLINLTIVQSLDILISKYLYEMFNFPGIKYKGFHIRWQI